MRASLISTSLHNTLSEEYFICCLVTPLPTVALPCGSRSINITRRFMAANEAARFILVVVFPTPPFWLAIAIIFPTVFPCVIFSRGRQHAARHQSLLCQFVPFFARRSRK